MDAACEGVGCTRPIGLFDAGGFASRVAGEVTDFKARDFVPKSYRKAVKVMARDIQLAVAAADLAVRDAHLVTKGIDESAVDVDGSRFACNIGAGLIAAELDELGAALTTALDSDGRFDIRRWGAEGMTNLTPLWLLKYLPNMLACHVTIIHDMRGPSNTITCGEASGLLSIGEAADHVARGAADLAVAGSAESRLNPMCMLRQDKLGRLAASDGRDPSEVCRPFDVDHCGTVMGEGGGLLILEDAGRAAGRDAKVYAEIVGFAGATDPVGMDPTRRHVGNVHMAAANALARAGIEPSQLGLIVAQGTGVPHEDTLEAEAIATLLAGADVPVVAATGLVGNCQAGASGVSAALAALAVDRQRVPASANFATAAAGCEALRIPREATAAAIDYVLVQAFSPTGQSAAMVLSKPEGSA
jgi:3-oxoacyl-[acyl-carrier-protein] synthase II